MNAHLCAAVTFVIEKKNGTHIKNYFAGEYPRSIPEGETSLAKKIVFERSPGETVFLDESDKSYSALTFLYQIEDPEGSDPHLSACDILGRVVHDHYELEKILKDSVYIAVGIPGESIQPMEVDCEPLNLKAAVHRIDSDLEKSKGSDLRSDLRSELQTQKTFDSFYRERASRLSEQIEQLRTEYATMNTSDFYKRLSSLRRAILEISRHEDTTKSEGDLFEMRNNYESMIHEETQKSLLEIKKSLSRQQKFSMIIPTIVGILTIFAIIYVGFEQASITEKIGSTQASIMEEQTEILSKQTEIQNQQLSYLTREGLRLVDWKPRTPIETDWLDQTFLTTYIENVGTSDIYVTDVRLMFSLPDGSTYKIHVSDFDPDFQPVKISGLSTEMIEIPLNPLVNEVVRKINQADIVNCDLEVVIQILNSNDISHPLEVKIRLRIVAE